MKKQILDFTTKAIVLFILPMLAVSCAKTTLPDLAGESTIESGKNTALSKSAVTGYWKDASTSVTTIDCTPGYVKKIVYTVGPFSAEPGEVITAHLQRQFGHSGIPPIMVASGIVIGENASVIDNGSTGFVAQLAGWSSSNMSDEENFREVVSRMGSYKFNAHFDSIYVSAVFYGQALTVVGGSGDLTLPAGPYGELIVVKETGVTWSQTQTSLLPFNATEGKPYVPFTPTLNAHFSLGPVTTATPTQIDVRYDVEATSEVPANGGYQTFGRNIIQASSATAVTGTNLTKQIQMGIIDLEHHSTWSHGGGAYYPNGVSGARFNSVVYTNGWEGENLYIEPGSAYLYSRMNLEVRDYKGFYEDAAANITNVTATEQVLYSVGPIDIEPNQVVEVRYQAAFSLPNGWATVDSKIVRATTPTATSGTGTTLVQPALARGFDPAYSTENMVQSTAEKNGGTKLFGQYYNVVVWRIQGASSLTALPSGELEVIKR